MTHAAKLKRISDCLESDRLARHGRGRRAGAGYPIGTGERQEELAPSPSAYYSANGFAISGAPEPVAETWPLSRGSKRGHHPLPHLAYGPVGDHSLRDRGDMALGMAGSFALAWTLLNWIAENKLDAFGWTAFFALIVDFWLPWTQKVAKLVAVVF